MPNPKSRGSRTNKNKRRTHKKLANPAQSICPQCKAVKRPHAVCPNCGTYKGREVVARG